MAQRQTLPVLPLRGTVIFPGLTQPIAAGRPSTLRAIEAALKGDRLVFAVAQRDNTEEPTADILYSMGVIARIGQIQRGLGGVQLLLQGEQRATALQYSSADGYLSAVIVPAEEMNPQTENDPAFTALQKETRERAAELGERRGLPEEVVHQVLDSVTDSGRFADLVAGYIELPVPEKQFRITQWLTTTLRMPRLLRRATFRFGSKARFGPGRSKGSTCSRSKAGVDGSAAMRIPGLMCCSTHRCATIRVSVRVSSFVSRIDQVRGTTSNSMVTGARERMRPASAPSAGTSGST